MQIIIIKAPSDVSIDIIKKLKDRVRKISYDKSYIMNKYIKYDLDDIDISDDLSEEDLFNLKDEALKINKAAICHLIEAIDEVISPMIAISTRIGAGIGRQDVSYFDIGNDKYIAAARRDGYHYSKTESIAYNYVLALNLSEILE